MSKDNILMSQKVWLSIKTTYQFLLVELVKKKIKNKRIIKQLLGK